MKNSFNIHLLLVLFFIHTKMPSTESRSLRLGRAVSYIANQTVCLVDSVVFRDGDPIPTDDPCESCKCRPPGFYCVLRECEIKPGCKAIRREGECCPEYQCGCEHNGQFFNDGDRIPNAESPCYSCYCQGSSITCALADCKFRFDCEPEYVPGECCPRYDHCPPEPTKAPTTTVSTTTTFSPAPVFIPSTSPAPTTSEPESAPTTTTTQTPINVQTEATNWRNESLVTSSELVTELATTNRPEILEVATTTTIPEIMVQTTTQESISSESDLKAVVKDELASGSLDKVEVSTPVNIPESITSGLIEIITIPSEEAIVEEDFPTTKFWVPDTSLAAEHKDSFDEVLVTTELPKDTLLSSNMTTNVTPVEIKEPVTSNNNLVTTVIPELGEEVADLNPTTNNENLIPM